MRLIGSIILIVIFPLFSGFENSVKDNSSTNAKIKAMFMYNFTKYIEWPISVKLDNFVIGVFGNTPLLAELTKMAGDNKYKYKGNLPFEIKKFSSIESLGKCHMLFIADEKSNYLEQLVAKMRENHTLIITENTGLIEKGSAINFVIINSKQEFELNRNSIKSSGLSMSSSLSAFAFKVI